MDNPEGTVPLDLNSVQGIPLGIGLVPPAIGMVHGMGMENPAMFMNMTTPMEGTFTHQPHFHQPTLMPAMSPVSSILSSLAGAPTPDNLTPFSINIARTAPPNIIIHSSPDGNMSPLSTSPRGASSSDEAPAQSRQSTRKRKAKVPASDATITIPINISRSSNGTPSFNGNNFVFTQESSDGKDDSLALSTGPGAASGGGVMVQIGGKMYEESQLDGIDESALSVEDRKQLKKQRRLVKNREAAQLFRQRQKEYIVNLERRAAELTQANHEASARVELLASENKLMKEQLVYLRNFMKQAVSFSFPFDPQSAAVAGLVAQQSAIPVLGVPMPHVPGDGLNTSIPLMKINVIPDGTNQQGVTIDGTDLHHPVDDLTKALYPD
eukprot:TRINITY_DN2421_c0_g1_i2.p1 TRINITY_DN2421_c0_g1~~TRINITY_DN2421_c0_g1_i2.p1  ORF type:complete len:381 (+),score=112.70 TRINITY_DN2421_c0_g1_i2:120-1262(+)